MFTSEVEYVLFLLTTISKNMNMGEGKAGVALALVTEFFNWQGW